MAANVQEVPSGPVNIDVLRGNFEDAGFVVKTLDKRDGLVIFEYNFPDEKREIALKSALCRNKADVTTKWRWIEKPHGRGELAQREQALIQFDSEDELRGFFTQVINDYRFFMEEQFGSEKSYSPESKVRNLTGRV